MAFLRHIGKSASRFQFDVLIMEISNFNPDSNNNNSNNPIDSINNSYYCTIERGSNKKFKTSDKYLIANKVRIYEVLTFGCTLYKENNSNNTNINSYLKKVFHFRLKSNEKATTRLGIRLKKQLNLFAAVNLAAFASKGVRHATLEFPLSTNTDNSPLLKVTIRCRWVNDMSSRDNNGYSSCSNSTSYSAVNSEFSSIHAANQYQLSRQGSFSDLQFVEAFSTGSTSLEPELAAVAAPAAVLLNSAGTGTGTGNNNNPTPVPIDASSPIVAIDNSRGFIAEINKSRSRSSSGSAATAANTANSLHHLSAAPITLFQQQQSIGLGVQFQSNPTITASGSGSGSATAAAAAALSVSASASVFRQASNSSKNSNPATIAAATATISANIVSPISSSPVSIDNEHYDRIDDSDMSEILSIVQQHKDQARLREQHQQNNNNNNNDVDSDSSTDLDENLSSKLPIVEEFESINHNTAAVTNDIDADVPTITGSTDWLSSVVSRLPPIESVIKKIQGININPPPPLSTATTNESISTAVSSIVQLNQSNRNSLSDRRRGSISLTAAAATGTAASDTIDSIPIVDSIDINTIESRSSRSNSDSHRRQVSTGIVQLPRTELQRYSTEQLPINNGNNINSILTNNNNTNNNNNSTSNDARLRRRRTADNKRQSSDLDRNSSFATAMASSAGSILHFIPYKSFQCITRFKEGNFGLIYSAVWESELVVIKVPKRRPGSDEWSELFSFINLPTHPNVLQFLGLCRDFIGLKFNAFCLVTKMQKSALKEYMQQEIKPILSQSQSQSISLQSQQLQLGKTHSVDSIVNTANNAANNNGSTVSLSEPIVGQLNDNNPIIPIPPTISTTTSLPINTSLIDPTAPLYTPLSILNILYDMASGLLHLHSNGIVHRDIALRNFLVTSTNRILISDFGLSRRVDESNPISYYKLGSISDSALPVRWSAPESLLTHKFTRMSDCWSFAVTGWELLNYGELIPYQSIITYSQVIYGVCSGSIKLDFINSVKIRICNQLKLLFENCFNIQPELRPTMKDIQSKLGQLIAAQQKQQPQQPNPSK